MRSKSWSFAIVLIAIVLCGAVALSFAQQAKENGDAAGWSGHRHERMERIARELNLTDAQKAQIKTMMQAQRATMQPLMQQMAQNRLAMMNATAGGAFDQAKVQAIANQQSQVEAQLEVQRASIHSQIYNQVLTADQKAKADEMQQKKIARINQHLQKLSQPATETSAQ